MLVPALGGCETEELELPFVSLSPDQAPTGHMLHELGEVELVDGETEELFFEASTETRAFTIVSDSGPDSHVAVVELISPDGTVVTHPEDSDDPVVNGYFANWAGPSTSVNRAVPRPHASAVLVPNSPRVAMVPGRWRFRIRAQRIRYDFVSEVHQNEPVVGSVRVGIVERTSDVPARGSVDLLLAFSPGAGIEASVASADPVVSQLVDMLRSVLATADVELGSIEYVDAPDLPSVVDLEGPSCLGGDDVNRALGAAPPSEGEIRILFIRHFNCVRWSSNEMIYGRDMGASIGGVSNGIPGIPGSEFDGLFVATQIVREHPMEGSLVAAHEVGHFLGLFHACEHPDLGVCDAIDDTSEDYTSGGPGAAGAVGNNIMVFNATLNTDPTFSPEQAQIIRTSAYVHPLP